MRCIWLKTLLALVAMTVTWGCGPRPEELRNELRREIQQLESKVERLEREKSAAEASLRAMREGTASPTTPGPEELARLYTVHGVRFGRLTRLVAPESGPSGPWTLRVHLTPTDEDGEPIKSAGRIEVQALTENGADPVHNWSFSAEQARAAWRGQALLYEYVLNCELPGTWEPAPLTVEVRFTDLLTGRQFSARQKVEPSSRRR
jgi:outer membrane murein-binding lipoprotein Lpp